MWLKTCHMYQGISRKFSLVLMRYFLEQKKGKVSSLFLAADQGR